MWIGSEAVLGIVDADQSKQLQRAGASRGAAEATVINERLGDLATNGIERIERRHRFLEDHRDPDAADAVQPARREADELLVAIARRAADAAVHRGQAHQRHHRLALA